MDTTEASKRQAKHGQRYALRTSASTTSTLSSTKPTRSLVSQASSALQKLDEWTDEMDHGRGLDFAIAMGHIDNLRLVVEQIINQEMEL